jgi:hypothetical protein
MLPDPVLPDPVPLGPASRYAGLSDAELLAWAARLSAARDQWCAQVLRFRQVGVTTALGGPCARALVDAHLELATEANALWVVLQVRLDEIRRVIAAAS